LSVAAASRVESLLTEPELPRRVLVLVENNSAPSDRRVWAESKTLASAGFEVTIVCPAGRSRDTSAQETVDGVEIHRYRPREARRAPWGYAIEYGNALWQMRRLVKRLVRDTGPFDVVHVCNPPDVLLWAARSLRTGGARIVFDHHDLVPELYAIRFGKSMFGIANRGAELAERRIFRSADVVIAPNESYRRIAIERGGKRREDVYVVRIAPDLELFRPGPPDPALKRGKPYLIAYAGTIGQQDGVDRALRSLQHLSRKRLDWHAVFAGGGDAVPAMRRLVFELGLDGAVEFAGHLHDRELLTLLSTADVCLSPEPPNALNNASTMIKVVEYLALERPVVAFDLPETRYTAADAAVYAASDDDRAFADCIDALLDDPSLRKELGARGRARIENELSWSRSAEELLAAYARALRPVAAAGPERAPVDA
jgi:glycosyltransferase involved in cell wall biosynthesis